MNLNNIRIVLIETSHPGNIGSTARAMLTMGLKELYLVNPARFPDKKAVIMSSGAYEVLDKATVVPTLQEAIADCHTIIGTSARQQRQVQWQLMDARECGEFVAQRVGSGKVAIVFGRESSGLTNEELEHCQFQVSIPVNPEYGSLNLASAVQVLAYECSMALSAFAHPSGREQEMATAADIEGFYQHLEQTLIDIRYLDPEKPRLLMRRLRNLYGRLQPSKSELNILRGMLSAAQGKKFIPRSEREK